jgi:hypothetical protein
MGVLGQRSNCPNDTAKLGTKGKLGAGELGLSSLIQSGPHVLFCFKMGSSCVAQVGLEPMDPADRPISVSLSA